MKMNEGPVDRIIRAIVGVALIAVGLFGGAAGAWLYITCVLGAVLLLTGIIGFCPLYHLLKFSTAKNK